MKRPAHWLCLDILQKTHKHGFEDDDDNNNNDGNNGNDGNDGGGGDGEANVREFEMSEFFLVKRRSFSIFGMRSDVKMYMYVVSWWFPVDRLHVHL